MYRQHHGKTPVRRHSDPILIEDETLAHLKIVIATKLRRQESFTATIPMRPRRKRDVRFISKFSLARRPQGTWCPPRSPYQGQTPRHANATPFAPFRRPHTGDRETPRG
ncbi:hypothetical protein CTI14_40370, partial [Methylobacterium radiotolerans]